MSNAQSFEPVHIANVSMHGENTSIYYFEDPRVIVYAKRRFTLAQVQQAIEDSMPKILRSAKDAAAMRIISAADAHLATKFGCKESLIRLFHARLGPPEMSLWAEKLFNAVGQTNSGEPSVIFRNPSKSIELANGMKVTLEGRRISIAWSNAKEVWSQNTLVTGRQLSIPQTVMISLKGRNFDEVVEGSMLSGAGLAIRNAWQNGGRLGVTFAKNDIPVSEIEAQFEARLPKAA